MNRLLLEVLATQATGSGNPAVSEILARMRSSSEGASAVDVHDLLGQQASGNPMMALLLQQLTTSAAAAPRDVVIEVESAGHDDSAPATADADAGDPMAELREQAGSMLNELHVLRERCDLLASALGACCLCWGHDPSCRICRGRGRPGFARPDEALMIELVLPAVRMLRAQRVTATEHGQQAI